jgi:hypothetical protein
MERTLTPEQAQEISRAMAALGDEIAFRWLADGCECRAQLMVERMQAMGLEPGRAWAVAVGRPLAYPKPDNPQHSYKWGNHVAPTVPVVGVEHGVLVIDPSLTQVGPLTLTEWASVLRARSFEVSSVGLSQTEMLSRLAARVLQGGDLDAMVFHLKLGEPPIAEVGGSGFWIRPDPVEGPSAYAHGKMKEYLDAQKQIPPAQP